MEDKLELNNLEESYIDVRMLLLILWKKKVFITFITLLFSISAVFYALSLPNYYKSSALLKIASEESSSPSLLSQYSGLASVAGISLPGGSSGNKANLAIATLKSRDFLKELTLIDESIVPALMATKNYDFINKEIIYDTSLYNLSKDEWLSKPIHPFKTIPSDLEVYEKYKNNVFSASINKETGYISLSITHISPVFSQKFLKLIISELNSISRTHDMNSSKDALEYLYSQAAKTSVTSINDSISKLIESQLQTQMMAQINDEYMLQVIDTAFVPELKAGPNRKAICIVAFLIGAILASLISIISHLNKDENELFSK